MTSADVRLSVGLEAKHLVFETVLRTACFDRDAPKGAINAVAFTAEGKLARKAGGYEHKKLKPRFRHPSSLAGQAEPLAAIRNVSVTHSFLRRGIFVN